MAAGRGSRRLRADVYRTQHGHHGAAFVVPTGADANLDMFADTTVASAAQWIAVNNSIREQGGTPVAVDVHPSP